MLTSKYEDIKNNLIFSMRKQKKIDNNFSHFFNFLFSLKNQFLFAYFFS